MALVEHQQAKAMAPAIEVDVERIVGGDGQRPHFVLAAAQQADVRAEGVAQLGVPLVQKVDGRRDDEGGPGGLADGEDGDMGLAGAGGQHDDATAAVAPPALECFELVRERIAAGSQRPGRLPPGTGVVLVRDLLAAKMFDQRAIMAPWARWPPVRGSCWTNGNELSVAVSGPATTTVPPS